MGGSNSKESPPPSPPHSPSTSVRSTPISNFGTGDRKKKYEDLQREELKKGTLYKDPDFPATSAILGAHHRDDPDIKWMRPSVCMKSLKTN